jgi:hypothetical protein
MGQEVWLAKGDELAAWIIKSLMSEGLEGLALAPLGQSSRASMELSRHLFKSSNYLERKVGAQLVGYIVEPDKTLLNELFDVERARNASFARGSHERLCCQSVVEDIVFSAIRLCRNDELKGAAFAFLARLTEMTITSEYWNTASYAITTLRFYNVADSEKLLKRFKTFCTPPLMGLFATQSYPNQPDFKNLEQERSFADGLLKRSPETLRSLESLLDDKDSAVSQANMSEERHKWFDEVFEAARDFEAA